ncbi:hypothetical protein HBI04_147430 [Parastagonospora nodorum]|nr:hypothetical protein HBH43_101080 [Parastagonospora nodorum]KAH4263870.1 hypothetical protein HBI03_094240 [Parastagonospora nodorum]KAH4270794.1 hypothetical protein HBI04_147430 [Parastagonospora nodorum]KAH5217120.1 hypothetical protein HBI62_160500 [Parastagonospora nodorum]KAH5395700.1 hypothetical protein HBI32_207030 [Parastagonospora nodorum]
MGADGTSGGRYARSFEGTYVDQMAPEMADPTAPPTSRILDGDVEEATTNADSDLRADEGGRAGTFLAYL